MLGRGRSLGTARCAAIRRQPSLVKEKAKGLPDIRVGFEIPPASDSMVARLLKEPTFICILLCSSWLHRHL